MSFRSLDDRPSRRFNTQPPDAAAVFAPKAMSPGSGDLPPRPSPSTTQRVLSNSSTTEGSLRVSKASISTDTSDSLNATGLDESTRNASLRGSSSMRKVSSRGILSTSEMNAVVDAGGGDSQPDVQQTIRHLLEKRPAPLIAYADADAHGAASRSTSRSNRSLNLNREMADKRDGTPVEVSRSNSFRGIASPTSRSRLLSRRRLRVAIRAVVAAHRFSQGVPEWRRREGIASMGQESRAANRRANILAARAGPERRVEDPEVTLASCLPLFPKMTPALGPSCVTSYLCIGDREDAANLPLLLSLKVTHILNMATNLPPPAHADSFVYCLKPIADNDSQSIGTVLPHCLEFIRDAHRSGGRVMVHCVKGVSRSVTIAVAYLISRSGPAWSLAAALSRIRAVRPQALPNQNFRLQLAHYEIAQQGASSVADIDSVDEIWDFAAWRKSSERGQALIDSAESRRSGKTLWRSLGKFFRVLKALAGFRSARVGVDTLDP